MAENQTNPQPVEVTPVQNTNPIGSQSGTSAAPLASGARANFGRIGQIPTSPTPITPARRK
jgi:hypothetical protein